MSDYLKKSVQLIGTCLWLLVLNELDVLREITEFCSIMLHF